MSNDLIEPENHKHSPDMKKKAGAVPEPHRTKERGGHPPKSKPGRHGGHVKGAKWY